MVIMNAQVCNFLLTFIKCKLQFQLSAQSIPV